MQKTQNLMMWNSEFFQSNQKLPIIQRGRKIWPTLKERTIEIDPDMT